MPMNETRKTTIQLGNGPSVDQFDSELCGKVDVFGTNFIGVKFPVWGRTTKAVVITDASRIDEIGTLYQRSPVDLYVGDQRCVEPGPDVAAIVGRPYKPLRQLARSRLPGFSLLRRFKHSKGIMRDLMFLRGQYSFDQEVGFNFGNS